MSALYGNLIPDDRTGATRTAHREITAVARSWSGSVSVTIFRGDDDSDGPIVEIHAGPGSTASPARLIFRAPLSTVVHESGTLAYHATWTPPRA